MRERWDELLSLLVFGSEDPLAAKRANEIEAAVNLKNARIATLEAALGKIAGMVHPAKAGGIGDAIREVALEALVGGPLPSSTAPIEAVGDASPKECGSCVWFSVEWPELDGLPNALVGRCHIRSVAGAFPGRRRNDHCGEHHPKIGGGA